MTTQDTREDSNPATTDRDGHGTDRPTFLLDLEGVERAWHAPTITISQIRELAGWALDQPIVMVNLATNEETALAENTTVELKPGHGFGRKFKFRRGSR